VTTNPFVISILEVLAYADIFVLRAQQYSRELIQEIEIVQEIIDIVERRILLVRRLVSDGQGFVSAMR
jgi:hypothetical protein